MNTCEQKYCMLRHAQICNATMIHPWMVLCEVQWPVKRGLACIVLCLSDLFSRKISLKDME